MKFNFLVDLIWLFPFFCADFVRPEFTSFHLTLFFSIQTPKWKKLNYYDNSKKFQHLTQYTEFYYTSLVRCKEIPQEKTFNKLDLFLFFNTYVFYRRSIENNIVIIKTCTFVYGSQAIDMLRPSKIYIH